MIVGASLAGCSTAISLAQAGASVALVERQPDPAAFKRVCSHLILPSALPALERLGLLERFLDAGAARTRTRMWAPWGWIVEPGDTPLQPGLNLRREVADPIARATAADMPGVDLLLGHSVKSLILDGRRVAGVEAQTRDGSTLRLRGKLVVGADGRASRVAQLAGVDAREADNARFGYAVYFQESGDADPGVAQLWMTDPQAAVRFPTDSGLTLYACLPTRDRLPEFKRDTLGALRAMIAELPDAPRIDQAEQASAVFGRLDKPNLWRRPTAPGVALVGDAACAPDPLAGVGCGWALEGGVRLGDSLAPALLGSEPLERGLSRYRRRHRRALAFHSRMIDDYSNGRPLNLAERALFSAAPRDERVAEGILVLGARAMQPPKLVPTVARAAAVATRHAVGERLRKPRRSEAEAEADVSRSA